jgi:HPt (histidine-containing phosphotransfer) domain-containing protein
MNQEIIERVDEDIYDLAQSYLSKVESQTRQVEQAVLAENQKDAFKLCHSLKGTSGSYGFTYLYEIAEKLDTSIMKQNWNDAGLLVNELKVYCKRVVLLAS